MKVAIVSCEENLSQSMSTPFYPLISVIMPTRNRRQFVEQAIRYYQAQDYPNKELIIVDNSDDDSIEDLIWHDASICYDWQSDRLSIGALRNRAVSLAHGDIIVHQDDDDVFSPQRLSLQVQPLLDGTADVSACYMNLLLRTRDTTLWSPSEKVHNMLFSSGVRAGTLMYRASSWQDGLRYKDSSLGEDAAYLQGLLSRGARLAQICHPGAYICVRHHNNVTDEIDGIEPPEWQRVPLEQHLSQEEIAFYRALALREVVA